MSGNDVLAFWSCWNCCKITYTSSLNFSALTVLSHSSLSCTD
jgi:hypothetical protein